MERYAAIQYALGMGKIVAMEIDGVSQPGRPHERRAASLRRTARKTTTTSHKTSNQNSAFAAAANAMSAAESGPERNGPPSMSHQAITPGWTKLESGSRTTDGIACTEASQQRIAEFGHRIALYARQRQLMVPLSVP